MTIVRTPENRQHSTPNAVMTTMASPSVGNASRSLWKVEMTPSSPGLDHVIDSEQIWAFIDGVARVTIGDDTFDLQAGDTAVVPGGISRRIATSDESGFVAIVTGESNALASIANADAIVPPWIQ